MGNIGQMMSSTGIVSEFFLLGNFAGTIGMALYIPMIMRIKMRFRSKELMITALLTMAIMITVIATTTSGVVIVGASLIFGVAKMVGMIEVLLPVQFILSRNGEKNRFYAIFYPAALILGQFGGITASIFSQSLSWQGIHFYAAATLLIMALVCVVFMHNKRFAKKMPLYYVDWMGLLLFSS